MLRSPAAGDRPCAQATLHAHQQRPHALPAGRRPQERQRSLRARAEDDDFEKRVAALEKKAGGGKGFGEAPAPKPTEAGAEAEKGEAEKPKGGKKQRYSFTGESVHWEGPPHRGDIASNLALAATILWIPLTIAAVTRGLSVKYRFTDKRFSVITDAPWKKEQLDIAYQEVKDAVTVSRAFGAWGDMVVTLRNNDKVELRSLPDFKSLRDYVLKRAEALRADDQSGKKQEAAARGFA